MFVVVVGEIERNSAKDKEYVLNLLDELKKTYSSLVIISSACEKGIGYFVRERCIEDKDNPDFGFIEFSIRVWTILDKAKLAQVYMSRNPSLVEIGEIFHVLTKDKKVGHVADLIARVKNAKLPLAVHHENGEIDYYNMIMRKGSGKITSSIQSTDLKSQLG